MKPVLRWTLSLAFLGLVAVACHEAADSPMAPTTAPQTDGDGDVRAMSPGPTGPGPAGPTGGTGAGPTGGPAGPGTGGAGGAGGGGSATPTPTPTPGSTPPPLPTPTPLLEVTNLQVASGSAYQLIRNANTCCAQDMGAAWIDYPYVLQKNFGASANDPLYMIRTAIADTGVTASPLITFDVNRCVEVTVIFADESLSVAGPPTAYPSWIVNEPGNKNTTGWFCSPTILGGAGPIDTFTDPATSATIDGAPCRALRQAGTVRLGPREAPITEPDAKMYTVFITAVTSSSLDFCPDTNP